MYCFFSSSSFLSDSTLHNSCLCLHVCTCISSSIIIFSFLSAGRHRPCAGDRGRARCSGPRVRQAGGVYAGQLERGNDSGDDDDGTTVLTLHDCACFYLLLVRNLCLTIVHFCATSRSTMKSTIILLTCFFFCLRALNSFIGILIILGRRSASALDSLGCSSDCVQSFEWHFLHDFQQSKRQFSAQKSRKTRSSREIGARTHSVGEIDLETVRKSQCKRGKNLTLCESCLRTCNITCARCLAFLLSTLCLPFSFFLL